MHQTDSSLMARVPVAGESGRIRILDASGETVHDSLEVKNFGGQWVKGRVPAMDGDGHQLGHWEPVGSEICFQRSDNADDDIVRRLNPCGFRYRVTGDSELKYGTIELVAAPDGLVELVVRGR